MKLRDVLRAMFIGSVLFALLHNTFAQDQSQPSAPPPAKKNKANADSCDGGLDIVPAKSMTFTRKRRPSKTAPSPADAKELKQEKTRENEGRSGE